MFLSFTNVMAGKMGRMSEEALEEHLPEMLSIFVNIQKKLHYKNPEETVGRVYADLQSKLMASRNGDFLTIQKEAPFSRPGKANLIRLLEVYGKNGAQEALSLYHEMKQNGDFTLRDNDLLNYTDGAGETRTNAVIIHTKDRHAGVAAEYWYLNYTFGTIEVVDACTVRSSNGKIYDQIRFKVDNGEQKALFFDASEFADQSTSKSDSNEPTSSQRKPSDPQFSPNKIFSRILKVFKK